MDWTQALKDINYLGVIAAAIASFVLGFVWYLWPVFGEKWAGLLGMSKEEADSTDGLGYVLSMAVVGSFVAAAFVAMVMSATATEGLIDGAVFGAIAGFALRYTSLVYHYGFARSPKHLATLDGAHDTLQLALMGAVIGAI